MFFWFLSKALWVVVSLRVEQALKPAVKLLKKSALATEVLHVA
jgi:hypothetical protein